MRWILNIPPPLSAPKVGVRSVPRFAAAMRLARALSSSGGCALDTLPEDAAEGADSARARRWASTYDARSPSGAGRAALGAGVFGAVGAGADGMLGVGLFSAIT